VALGSGFVPVRTTSQPRAKESEAMPGTTSTLKSQKAPCGRIVDGESYEDQDEEVLVTSEVDYACGCKSIRHEYHDGSVAFKLIHHNGKVLVDKLDGAE
jgi:hypothetical protein